jgi:hypothetical protein
MKNHNHRPLTALAVGLLAGAAGSAVQSIFFKLTSRVIPKPPKDAFTPSDPAQKHENATETVARRFVQGFMHAGDLNKKKKALGGQIVHYAFGAGWGGVYALARESVNALSTPIGITTFGTGVWMASDNLILPTFKLAGWPHRYPAKNHAYALAAHLVYGAAVWGVYEGISSFLERSVVTQAPSDMKIDVIPDRSSEDVPYLQSSTHLRDAS